MGPFDGFVNPALALGAALCAVPLAIHLLNRQRHKPMPWAAMRFVLAAWRKTRRRARLEELLLLLLRMAAVALLALAVARPFLGQRSPLERFTERRRDLVLIVDASASTGWREEARTVFERIVDRARAVIGALDAGRGDRVRLIAAASSPRLLSWRSPEEALSLLATLREPSDEPLDLAAALGEAARFAEEGAAGGETGALEIRLLTDLQRSSFLPAAGRAAAPDPAAQDPLQAQLDRLRALDLGLKVEDLGPREAVPDNLGVVEVAIDGPALGVGHALDVAVAVRNFGSQPRAGVRLALTVDGERRPARAIDVPARGEARAVFPLTFRSSGEHALEARLEADRLAFDDARALVVRVPPPVRVLLVDGEPAEEIERDEVGLLAAALEPPRGDEVGGAAAPFDVRTVEPHALQDPALELFDHDVIVLANVGAISSEVVERLERRVAAGAALLVTAGGHLESAREAQNRRLWRADGTGLLPCEIGPRVAVADRRSGHWRVREFEAAHPALAFFADERWKPLLTEVPIYEFLAVRLDGDGAQPGPPPPAAEGAPPRAGVRVLARLDDDAASPLLLERPYDRGKVFLWLTSVDMDWARVAESARTFVPLFHELVRYAGASRSPLRTAAVGESFRAEVDSAAFPRNAAVIRPDGSRRALAGEPEAAGPLTWRLPAFDDTARAGLYRIEAEGGAAAAFAVLAQAREGDLERLRPGELRALHPALEAVAEEGGGSGEEEGPSSGRGELWRALAALCFAALVLETLLAAWIGRSRRIG